MSRHLGLPSKRDTPTKYKYRISGTRPGRTAGGLADGMDVRAVFLGTISLRNQARNRSYLCYSSYGARSPNGSGSWDVLHATAAAVRTPLHWRRLPAPSSQKPRPALFAVSCSLPHDDVSSNSLLFSGSFLRGVQRHHPGLWADRIGQDLYDGER